MFFLPIYHFYAAKNVGGVKTDYGASKITMLNQLRILECTMINGVIESYHESQNVITRVQLDGRNYLEREPRKMFGTV